MVLIVSLIVLVATLLQIVSISDASQTILPVSFRDKGGDERELQVIRRNATPNNYCTNATIIDPTVKTVLTIYNTSTLAIDDAVSFPPGSKCYSLSPVPTLWYKFTNPLTTPLSVDIVVDTIPTFASIMISRGNCSTLRCVGRRDDYPSLDNAGLAFDFVAEARTSYYILLHANASKPFNVTITGRSQYFALIDSVDDKVIGLLRDNVDYSLLRRGLNSSKLNIMARFTVSQESIKSVRLTYDNTTRNICNHNFPYSVFGDSKGNKYNNATIPLGRHKVTATTYAQTNCTGPAGTTMVQEFTVTGCVTRFEIYKDCNRQYVQLIPFTSQRFATSTTFLQPTKLPIHLSIRYRVDLNVFLYCSFPIRSLRTEFRNATTGQVITLKPYIPRIPTESIGLPLFQGRHLDKGTYSIRTIINNIVHPSINFTVVRNQCS